MCRVEGVVFVVLFVELCALAWNSLSQQDDRRVDRSVGCRQGVQRTLISTNATIAYDSKSL